MKTNTITKHLIFSIVAFSSLVTLVITATQLGVEYNKEISKMDGQLRRIETVELPAIARSVWMYDRGQLRTQIEGVINLPYIDYVEIREALDPKNVASGNPNIKNEVVRKLPIKFKGEFLGTLIVKSEKSIVYSKIVNRAGLVLLSNGLKTFVVSFFLFWLFQAKITRPIEELSLIASGKSDPEEFDGIVGYAEYMEIKELHKALVARAAIERTLEEKNERLSQNQEQLRLLKDRLLEASKKVLAAQEDERRFIAQELHDDLGQSLVALKFAVQQRLNGTYDEPHTKDLEILNDLIDKLKTLSGNLKPLMLDDMGLVSSIEWLLKKSIPSNIATSFDCNLGDKRFPIEIETTIFRIVQEGISNCLKHSDAHEIRIQLNKREGNLEIQIADDGKGFNLSDRKSLKSRDANQLGISGMRERMTVINGILEVVSDRMRGTVVRGVVPLPT